MLEQLTKFLDSTEKRNGGVIPRVYMQDSERPFYTGEGFAILSIDGQGKIKDVKYLKEFSDAYNIKPYVDSLGKNFVAGQMHEYYVSWIISEGNFAWGFADIFEHLEEQYRWEHDYN